LRHCCVVKDAEWRKKLSLPEKPVTQQTYSIPAPLYQAVQVGQPAQMVASSYDMRFSIHWSWQSFFNADAGIHAETIRNFTGAGLSGRIKECAYLRWLSPADPTRHPIERQGKCQRLERNLQVLVQSKAPILLETESVADAANCETKSP
jgi:hypothetical protein